MAWTRVRVAVRRTTRQAGRIALTSPSRDFGAPVAVPFSAAAGGGLGVDRVRLAFLPAGLTVGSVDLDDVDVVVEEECGHAG